MYRFRFPLIVVSVVYFVFPSWPTHAAIVAYNEFNGLHLPGLDGNGDLTGVGGTYSGMNVSDVSSADWVGIENDAFQIAVGNNIEHYWPYGTGGIPYFGDSDITTLTGGPQDGNNINNANLLGLTDNVRYYVDGDGTLSVYGELGNNALVADYTWTNLSGGGDLDGQAVTTATGFKTLGGLTDLSEGYLLNVEADGTFEYYFLPTGVYDAGLEATYGSWTTLQNGLLDGLTLVDLASNPEGTINGFNYRYLGLGNDQMFFEINAVPEPSSCLLLGLCTIAGICWPRRQCALRLGGWGRAANTGARDTMDVTRSPLPGE